MNTTTQDVKEQSSTDSSEVDDMDDAPDSSQEKQSSPENVAKGFAEAVAKGLEEAQAKAGVDTAKSTKGEDTSDTTETKETVSEDKEDETSKETSDEKKEDETKEEVKEDESEETKTIPYDRFREVNTAKNKAETTLKKWEPYVKAQENIASFCEKHGLTAEDYSFGLGLVAALRNDPQRAMEMLKPHLSQLQQLNGEVLPEDLQKAVADGDITEAWAKNLAKERAKNSFSEQRVQKTQEQIRAERTQAEFRQVQTTVNSWIDSKKKSDPDFKPSTDGLDGPMEDFWMKLNAEGAQAQIKDMNGLISLMEKIYSDTKKKYARFTPKVNGTKHLHNNTTTSTKNGAPKTFAEAVAAGARASGVNWTPPKR